MNESTVLVLVERHKLKQDAATALQLALGHYVNCVLHILHAQIATCTVW